MIAKFAEYRRIPRLYSLGFCFAKFEENSANMPIRLDFLFKRYIISYEVIGVIKFIKKHYHWIIAAVLFLMLGSRGGVSNNLMSLHLIPVTEALSITRAQYSLANSVCFIVAMLSAMFSGVIFQRFSFRQVMTTMLISGGCALVIMARAESYGLFILGYMMMGMTNGICAEATTTRVVSVWFHKHLGAVMGAVASATGLGGSIVCIIQTALIEAYSYQASLYFGAALLATCGVIALILVRSEPSKMGLLPYGAGEKVEVKKRGGQDHWEGFSMEQLVRMPVFYMLIVGTFFTCVLPYLAFNIIVPHLRDRGLSAAEASTAQSVMLLVLSGIKLLAGYLCDAIGAKKVAIICLGFNVVGLTLLATVTGFVPSMVAVLIFTATLPNLTVVIPLLGASLFGYRDQGKYLGVLISMVSGASIVATPISNAVFDVIGTYCPVFLVGAGLTVLLIIGYLVMYRMVDKERKKLEA